MRYRPSPVWSLQNDREPNVFQSSPPTQSITSYIIVYSGGVGSSSHSHTGGGGEFICLPNNPKYDQYKDGFQSNSYIYGTEYEVNSYNPFKNNLHDHDAPCVVCYVQSRATQLVIPARNDCPSGWTEEYHGYLVAGYHSHKHSTNFLCIDG